MIFLEYLMKKIEFIRFFHDKYTNDLSEGALKMFSISTFYAKSSKLLVTYFISTSI